MERDGARADADAIESSRQFVRDAAACIGVTSHKYGRTPICADRDPDGLSITELEFNGAMRLKRPILPFLTGEKHPVTEAELPEVPKYDPSAATPFAREADVRRLIEELNGEWKQNEAQRKAREAEGGAV